MGLSAQWEMSNIELVSMALGQAERARPGGRASSPAGSIVLGVSRGFESGLAPVTSCEPTSQNRDVGARPLVSPPESRIARPSVERRRLAAERKKMAASQTPKTTV